MDTLGGAALREQLEGARSDLTRLQREAEQGQKLRDGLHVVLVGPPNAGKSSLLNAMAGSDRAIVTAIPGTTRDLLRETIRLDGVELTMVDTAGLRDAGDAIEAEGIRRAKAELAQADLALVVVDARDPQAARETLIEAIQSTAKRVWVHNKADLLAQIPENEDPDTLHVSARTGLGLEVLHQRLLALSGAGTQAGDAANGTFSARERHVQALLAAAGHLHAASLELRHERLELAAEALSQAHSALGGIGGKVDADGLLGHIFSAFCVGK